MNLSCSSACFAILTACFDKISRVWTACLDNNSLVCPTFCNNKKKDENYIKNGQIQLGNQMLKIESLCTFDRSLKRFFTASNGSPPLEFESSESSSLFAIICGQIAEKACRIEKTKTLLFDVYRLKYLNRKKKNKKKRVTQNGMTGKT